MLTTSVECSILSTASISNVPNARLINAPEFSGYASTAMTSIAASNRNHESDETITTHSELEDNDDGSQMMLGAEISCSIVYIDVCIAPEYRLYKVSLHLLELRNTLLQSIMPREWLYMPSSNLQDLKNIVYSSIKRRKNKRKSDVF